jgi:hypothetical protein
MKTKAQKAKGQVPEHYRKQSLNVTIRVEKATKISEGTFRRILSKQQKQ